MKIVPTYLNGDWTTTTFDTDQEWLDFLLPLFKEPGEYRFDETSKIFNEEARKFNATGVYLNAPIGGKDFRKYWDAEKAKCRLGVIYQNNGKTWYLTRDYYMWLNFLPIYDKEEKEKKLLIDVVKPLPKPINKKIIKKEKKQPKKKIVSKKENNQGIILPKKKPLIAGSKKKLLLKNQNIIVKKIFR